MAEIAFTALIVSRNLIKFLRAGVDRLRRRHRRVAASYTN